MACVVSSPLGATAPMAHGEAGYYAQRQALRPHAVQPCQTERLATPRRRSPTGAAATSPLSARLPRPVSPTPITRGSTAGYSRVSPQFPPASPSPSGYPSPGVTPTAPPEVAHGGIPLAVPSGAGSAIASHLGMRPSYVNQRRTLPVQPAQRLAVPAAPSNAAAAIAGTAKTVVEQLRPGSGVADASNSLSSSTRRQPLPDDRGDVANGPRRGPTRCASPPSPQWCHQSPPQAPPRCPPSPQVLATRTTRTSMGGTVGRATSSGDGGQRAVIPLSPGNTTITGAHTPHTVARGTPEDRQRRLSGPGRDAVTLTQPSPEARPKRTVAEQRRISDRLSNGRCGDPRHTALMRRLNESASWLSEVSGVSDDEPPPDVEGGQEAAPALDHRRLCLAEMLNESATFLDESGSENSVGDGDEQLEPQQEEAGSSPVPNNHAIVQRAGVLREDYNYVPSPVVSAGVARSFSAT